MKAAPSLLSAAEHALLDRLARSGAMLLHRLTAAEYDAAMWLIKAKLATEYGRSTDGFLLRITEAGRTFITE